jgi:hypothetical protein
MAFASLVATSTRRVHIAIITNGPAGLKTVSKFTTEQGHTQAATEQVFLRKLADTINTHMDLSGFEPSTSRLPSSEGGLDRGAHRDRLLL